MRLWSMKQWVLMENRDHDICPLEYPGFLQDRYFIEGIVIPRCWHSCNDAILPGYLRLE